jgi:hypothetical protein
MPRSRLRNELASKAPPTPKLPTVRKRAKTVLRVTESNPVREGARGLLQRAKRHGVVEGEGEDVEEEGGSRGPSQRAPQNPVSRVPDRPRVNLTDPRRSHRQPLWPLRRLRGSRPFRRNRKATMHHQLQRRAIEVREV